MKNQVTTLAISGMLEKCKGYLPVKGGVIDFVNCSDEAISKAEKKLSKDGNEDIFAAVKSSIVAHRNGTASSGKKAQVVLSDGDVMLAFGLDEKAWKALPGVAREGLKSQATAKAKKAEKTTTKVSVSDKTGVVMIHTGSRYPACIYANALARLFSDEGVAKVRGFLASDFAKCSHKSLDGAKETAELLRAMGLTVTDEQIAGARIAEEKDAQS